MEVWNVGKGGYRKCPLGQGKVTIDIDTLIHHSGGSQVLDIPLDYKNSRQGVVSLRLHIDPVDETRFKYPQRMPIQAQQERVNDSPPQQVDTANAVWSENTLIAERNYSFKIDSLRAFQLVDTGNLLDKQDPSITITLGSKIFQTARSNSTKFVF